jgi:hypothetical protein
MQCLEGSGEELAIHQQSKVNVSTYGLYNSKHWRRDHETDGVCIVCVGQIESGMKIPTMERQTDRPGELGYDWHIAFARIHTFLQMSQT